MSTINRMMGKAKAAILRQGVRPQDADDIVQEAFARLEAYTRTHELRSQEAFLITAARNIGKDEARRRWHSATAPDALDFEDIADGAPSPEEHARVQERLRRANSGLARLDTVTRRCLLQQRVDGLTFPQIAEREGMSVSAVEKRVARAVLFLTRWMDGW